jgi:hypothetical protein
MAVHDGSPRDSNLGLVVTSNPELLPDLDYIFAMAFALGSRCIVSEPSLISQGSAADYPRLYVRASSNSPAFSTAISRGSCLYSSLAPLRPDKPAFAGFDSHSLYRLS